MRVSREEKERSRQRIVAAASRRFRGHGIAGTSVADVMGDAELTHGGFYRHFDSKEELLGAALDDAFAELLSSLEGATTGADHREAVGKFTARYLSTSHITAREQGCPIAAMATEIPREADVTRAVFAVGVERVLRALAGPANTPPSADGREAAALLLMQLVGAVVLARSADTQVAKDLLRVARSTVAVRPSARAR